ncbi:type I restriction-modification system endonuclease [Ancylomarina longa]|uniref:Type I restriction-modification system endonuclease n=1 Tax=Ancylomarina longa TaxID=2487017 RepID=A0A434AX00_9BACT|nr:type I restriction-modification system endonuclease [Ancylomarina longa]RUT78949.1 type I restriction-modification system endonuclease [Ancylomarina longa]
MTTKTNFDFLIEEYSFLANLGKAAELYVYSDPAASMTKTRTFGEKLCQALLDMFGIDYGEKKQFNNYLREIKKNDLAPTQVVDLLYTIKNHGNLAVHDDDGNVDKAITCLLSAFKCSKWFVLTYAVKRSGVEELRFFKPVKVDSSMELSDLNKRIKDWENKYIDLQKEYKLKFKNLQVDKSRNPIEDGRRFASKINLSEAETRKIIDRKLAQVGWEVDSVNLNYKKNGTLPKAGKYMAIAEWKCGRGWSDYALFCGKELLGLIEAKRYGKDVISDLSQAKEDAINLEEAEDIQLIKMNGNVRVPFLFATNGRDFHPQLPTKSGIWFLDSRVKSNIAEPLKGWMGPHDLKHLLKFDANIGDESLKKDSIEYLKSENGLWLRYYQIEAIQAVEELLCEKPETKQALLAMATGTGKTRTVLGLAYRLIKAKRFKRILFLVDRKSLGEQALDSFVDVPIEKISTFEDNYDIKKLKDRFPDLETKLHVSTVQGLVQRLFYSDNGQIPSVGAYDCIIVDEAHRGYILDKEIDEDQLGFKDQKDYMSKYKMVIDYFDAFVLGLTATPALHTIEIFGKPIYRYTYEQAVLDDFLIPYEPPYLLKTEQNTNGVTWKSGDKPMAYDKSEDKIVELDALEDEISFEIEHFNKKILTPEFNKTIVKELCKFINPEKKEKTLVFAANDDHADELVNLFKIEFKEAGYDIEDDTVMKITGSVVKPDPQQRITNFKNEDTPNVVVTVDLLTTGIDVPKICNLVFMRRVNSRILYEQMIGRATRKCESLKKEIFRIFDAVDIYSNMQEVSSMQPMVAKQSQNFASMIEEFDLMETNEVVDKQIKQILIKYNRKKKRLPTTELESFQSISGGLTPDQFQNEIQKAQDNGDGQMYIQENFKVFKYLDAYKNKENVILIANEEDKLLSVERDYDITVSGEDFLNKFQDFVINNPNHIAAVTTICKSPKELDRVSLKELRVLLKQNGFSKERLNAAWTETKNQDIGADIISFIRTMALGDSLISHEERILSAMSRVRQQRKWDAIQKKWLDSFEKQLLRQSILKIEDLDKNPFAKKGGVRIINKAFDGNVEQVLDLISDELYAQLA